MPQQQTTSRQCLWKKLTIDLLVLWATFSILFFTADLLLPDVLSHYALSGWLFMILFVLIVIAGVLCPMPQHSKPPSKNLLRILLLPIFLLLYLVTNNFPLIVQAFIIVVSLLLFFLVMQTPSTHEKV